jgi:hypothetical protein
MDSATVNAKANAACRSGTKSFILFQAFFLIDFFRFYPLQTSKTHSFLLREDPPSACRFFNVPTAIFTVGAVAYGLGAFISGFAPAGAAVMGPGLGIWVGHQMYTRIKVVRELGAPEGVCCSVMTGLFCPGCSSVQITDTLADQGHRIRLFTQ